MTSSTMACPIYDVPMFCERAASLAIYKEVVERDSQRDHLSGLRPVSHLPHLIGLRTVSLPPFPPASLRPLLSVPLHVMSLQ